MIKGWGSRFSVPDSKLVETGLILRIALGTQNYNDQSSKIEFNQLYNLFFNRNLGRSYIFPLVFDLGLMTVEKAGAGKIL